MNDEQAKAIIERLDRIIELLAPTEIPSHLKLQYDPRFKNAAYDELRGVIIRGVPDEPLPYDD